MSPCLIEMGSPLSYLDPTLSIMAGFDSIQFEDQVAELTVGQCQQCPERIWQQSDIGSLALRVIQSLNPFGWNTLDADLMKSLLVGTIRIVTQIVPYERRDF